MEDAPRDRKFRVLMMSAPVDASLLDAERWIFSENLHYQEEWYKGKMRGWLEGNVVLTNDNKIMNVLRYAFHNGVHRQVTIVNVSNDGQNVSINPDKNF